MNSDDQDDQRDDQSTDLFAELFDLGLKRRLVVVSLTEPSRDPTDLGPLPVSTTTALPRPFTTVVFL